MRLGKKFQRKVILILRSRSDLRSLFWEIQDRDLDLILDHFLAKWSWSDLRSQNKWSVTSMVEMSLEALPNFVLNAPRHINIVIASFKLKLILPRYSFHSQIKQGMMIHYLTSKVNFWILFSWLRIVFFLILAILLHMLRVVCHFAGP